jgi:hypothetical protein
MRNLHANHSPVDLVTHQLSGGVRGIPGVVHRHEGKPFGAAAELVHRQAGFGHLAELGENVLHFAL